MENLVECVLKIKVNKRVVSSLLLLPFWSNIVLTHRLYNTSTLQQGSLVNEFTNNFNQTSTLVINRNLSKMPEKRVAPVINKFEDFELKLPG